MKTKILLLISILAISAFSCKTSKKAAREKSTSEVSEDQLAAPPIEKPAIRILEKDMEYEFTGNTDFKIDSAWCKGDILHVNVNYSGGCGTHDFSLVWKGMYFKSLPMKVHLFLIHQKKNETCEEFIREELRFDISSLSTGSSNKLIIMLNAYKGKPEYVKEQ